MKKCFKLSATLLLVGVLFAGCIKNDPSDGIEAMRFAKADLIEANAEWVRAQIKVQEATIALIEAQAEGERAAIALTQAQVEVAKAEAAVKAAEAQAEIAAAKAKEAAAEAQRIENEYQIALNQILLEKAEAQAAAELAHQAELAKIAEEKARKEAEATVLDVEVLIAQREALIAKFNLEATEYQNKIKEAMRKDSLAALEFQGALLKAQEELEVLKLELAEGLEGAQIEVVKRYLADCEKLNALVMASMSEEQDIKEKIAEYNAELIGYQTVAIPAIERKLAEEKAKAEANYEAAQKIYDIYKEAYDIALGDSVEKFEAWYKGILNKIAELNKQYDQYYLQYWNIIGSDEYLKAEEADAFAENELEDFLIDNDLDISVTTAVEHPEQVIEAIHTMTFSNNEVENKYININDLNLSVAWETPHDTKYHNGVEDVLATLTYNETKYVAAIKNGVFGIYKQTGKTYEECETVEVNTYNRLLSFALNTIKTDRIFRFQGAYDAEATRVRIEKSRDDAIKAYQDAYNEWMDIYKHEVLAFDGPKAQAWKEAIIKCDAEQAKAVEKAEAEYHEELAKYLEKKAELQGNVEATKAVKEAAEAAKLEQEKKMNLAYDAMIKSQKAFNDQGVLISKLLDEAEKALNDYQQAFWTLVGGTFTSDQRDILQNWLKKITLTEILGGLTFDAQALVELFTGIAIPSLDNLITYIAGGLASVNELHKAAQTFKEIVDRFYTECENYNGYKGFKPVLECNSIYAYHAWLIIYGAFEGATHSYTIGADGKIVIEAGAYNAVPQLMKHFLCADSFVKNYNNNISAHNFLQDYNLTHLDPAKCGWFWDPQLNTSNKGLYKVWQDSIKVWNQETNYYDAAVADFEKAEKAYNAAVSALANIGPEPTETSPDAAAIHNKYCKPAADAWCAEVMKLTELEIAMFGKYVGDTWKAGYTKSHDIKTRVAYQEENTGSDEFYFYLPLIAEGKAEGLLMKDGKEYYPALEPGYPVYWKFWHELWVYNVTLEENDKFYRAPEYSGDVKLWTPEDIVNAVALYPFAMGEIHRYDNYNMVYNHQDGYEALMTAIENEAANVQLLADQANKDGQDALIEEFNKLMTNYVAARNELDTFIDQYSDLSAKMWVLLGEIGTYEDILGFWDYKEGDYFDPAESYELFKEMLLYGVEGSNYIKDMLDEAKEQLANAEDYLNKVLASIEMWNQELGEDTDLENYALDFKAKAVERIQNEINIQMENLKAQEAKTKALSKAYQDAYAKLQNALENVK